MKRFLLLLILFSLVACDNVLENLDTLATEETLEPYSEGESYTVIYSQTYNRSYDIKIYNGERFLKERIIGEFPDSTQLSREFESTIVLPAETANYSIVDEYSQSSTTLSVTSGSGSYLYIVCSSTGLYAYQSATRKSADALYKLLALK